MIEEDSFVALIVARTSRTSRIRRRIAVRKNRLKIFLFALALLVGAGVCGIVYLAQEPARLASENSRLRAENEENRHRLYSLVNRMESIEDASRRLAEISGVDASLSSDEIGHGVGGPSVETSDTRLITVAQEQADELLEDLETYAQMIQRERERTPSIWPVTGRISDYFGVRHDPFGGATAEIHTGQDISTATGTPVVATGSGRVEFAGTQNGYGNIVIIAHGEGLTTRYAHLSAIETTVGAEVARGSVIGRVGSTGRSTGPHLHYEVRVGDNPVDPRRYLPSAVN